AGVTSFTAYYRFDQPPYSDNGRVQTTADTRAFALDSNNTHTTNAADEGTTADWLGGSDVRTALLPDLQGITANATITIQGFASYEGPPPPNVDKSKRDYNADLARRRALGLQAIIEDLIADPARNLQGKHLTVPPGTANMSN